MNRKKTNPGTGNRKVTTEAEYQRESDRLALDAMWHGEKHVQLFVNDAGTVACADCVKEEAWLKEARALTYKDCEDSMDVDIDDQPFMNIKPECCMCGDRMMFSLLPEGT